MMLRYCQTGRGFSGKKRPTKRDPRNTEQVSRQEHGDPSNTNVHRDVTPPPDQTLVSNTLPATQTLLKKWVRALDSRSN